MSGLIYFALVLLIIILAMGILRFVFRMIRGRKKDKAGNAGS